MAKQVAEDYAQLMGGINRIKANIKELSSAIDRIHDLKIDIFNDTSRKNNLAAVLLLCSEDTIDSLDDDVDKLDDLNDYLETQGFLNGE